MFHTQLSANARIVIESLYLPEIVSGREGPITIRMNNLNTHVYDSQNYKINATLIYDSEGSFSQMTLQNNSPEILYNFSISSNFFQNGNVEF